MENIEDLYNQDNQLIILFLGAGFDRHFGLPNFDELVEQVYNYLKWNFNECLIKDEKFIKEIYLINCQIKKSNEFTLDLYNTLIQNQIDICNINWNTLENKFKISKKDFDNNPKIILYKIIGQLLNCEKKLSLEKYSELNKFIKLLENQNFEKNKILILTTNISDSLDNLNSDSLDNSNNVIFLHKKNESNKNFYILESDFLLNKNEIHYEKHLEIIFKKVINNLSNDYTELKVYFLGYNFNDPIKNYLFDFLSKIDIKIKYKNKKSKIIFLFFNKKIKYEENQHLYLNDDLPLGYDNILKLYKKNYFYDDKKFLYYGVVNKNNLEFLINELKNIKPIVEEKKVGEIKSSNDEIKKYIKNLIKYNTNEIQKFQRTWKKKTTFKDIFENIDNLKLSIDDELNLIKSIFQINLTELNIQILSVIKWSKSTQDIFNNYCQIIEKKLLNSEFLFSSEYEYVKYILINCKNIKLSKKWIQNNKSMNFLFSYFNWTISDYKQIINDIKILKIIIRNIFKYLFEVSLKNYKFMNNNYFFQIELFKFRNEKIINTNKYIYFDTNFESLIISIKNNLIKDNLKIFIKKEYDKWIKNNSENQFIKFKENIKIIIKDFNYYYKNKIWENQYSWIMYRYIISVIIYILYNDFSIDFLKNDFKKADYKTLLELSSFIEIKFDKDNYNNKIDSIEKLEKYTNSSNDLFWLIEQKKEIINLIKTNPNFILNALNSNELFNRISEQLIFTEEDLKKLENILNKIAPEQNNLSYIKALQGNDYFNEINSKLFYQNIISEDILKSPTEIFKNFFINKKIIDFIPLIVYLDYMILKMKTNDNFEIDQIIKLWLDEKLFSYDKEKNILFYNKLHSEQFLNKNENENIQKEFIEFLFNDEDNFNNLPIHVIRYIIDGWFYIRKKTVKEKYWYKICDYYFNFKIDTTIINEELIVLNLYTQFINTIALIALFYYDNLNTFDELATKIREFKIKSQLGYYKWIFESWLILFSNIKKNDKEILNYNYNDLPKKGDMNNIQILFQHLLINNRGLKFLVNEKMYTLFLIFIKNFQIDMKLTNYHIISISICNTICQLLKMYSIWQLDFQNIETLLIHCNEKDNIISDCCFYLLNKFTEINYDNIKKVRTYILNNRNNNLNKWQNTLASCVVNTINLYKDDSNEYDYNSIAQIILQYPNLIKIDDSLTWEKLLVFFNCNKIILEHFKNIKLKNDFIINNIIKNTKNINLFWLEKNSLFYIWFKQLDIKNKSNLIIFFKEKDLNIQDLLDLL